MALSETEAKIVAIVALGIGGFISGIIPACFTCLRGGWKLLLSSLLCFGGGVLFATSLLHMLPEVQEALPNYAEFVFCCGFFILYFVDEIVHFFWGRRIDPPPQLHTHDNSEQGDIHNSDAHCRHSLDRSGSFASNRNSSCLQQPHHPNDLTDSYNRSLTGGSAAKEHDGYLNLVDEPNVESNITPCLQNNQTSYGTVPAVEPTASDVPSQYCDEGSTLLDHGTHMVSCAISNTGLTGLMVALTLHSLLEGLAIGLQTKSDEVLLLLGAVASHKFVVGFCLGIELTTTLGTILKHTIAITMFAGGSSLGIAIGMLVSQDNNSWMTGQLVPVLQGLASGTLLYVTVSEVLPKERERWRNTPKRCAGIIQFLSVICGFSFMYILNTYMGEN